MTDQSLVPLLQVGMKIVNDDGTPTEWFRNGLNALILRTGTETENAILGVINGAAQQAAALEAANAARLAGDQATAAAGDGTGVSNGGTWVAGASADLAWVVLKALQLTPTGPPGDYSINVAPDETLGAIAPASGGMDVFEGEWRLIEELSSGGTEHVLATGAMTVTYTPASEITIGEGQTLTVNIPAFVIVVFSDLPTGLLPANETSAAVDIRLEIRRAPAALVANNVSALSGAMTATWTA
jgi:hypothetical protein